MDITTIRAAIARKPFKPFKPFKIRADSSDSYRVDHPEDIAIFESAATVFLNTSDLIAILDLDQITGMTYEKAGRRKKDA